jgi:hypothetical protein
MDMSTEKKNLIKRDYALNDATSGQMGEEPRSVYEPESLEKQRLSQKGCPKAIYRHLMGIQIDINLLFS